MQVEYLVRISLPDDGWDVNMLEEACWKAGRETSQGLFLDQPKSVSELIDYLYSGQDEKQSLKDKVEARRVLVCSPGAMEKNIDIVIGRRFKKNVA